MTQFSHKHFAILIFCLIGFVLSSCNEGKSVNNEKEQLKKQLSDPNAFFSDEILDSDLADEKDVICPGATEEEAKDLNHPQIVRGSVVAPRIQASFGIPFIKEAQAVPIPGEFPTPNVKVRLFEGFDEPKMISETTTDALGRFCLKLSWTKTFDGNHFIEALIGDEKLRRLSPTQKIAIVSTQSEAVFRIYKNNPSKTRSRSLAVNLQTIADTQVDTLNPISVKPTIAETVTLLVENLKADERVQKSLQSNNSSGQNKPK